MDEAFACLMSDLLKAEHPRAVLQVDMVGCEHTDTCLAVKYTNCQVQHTIGQKQTEKCQITDVRMAKLAKDAQREVAPAWRRAQRRLAQRVGMAPALVSKHSRLLGAGRCGGGSQALPLSVHPWLAYPSARQ